MTEQDAIRSNAEEMLRLLKLCPANGVTEIDIATALLARERSAGKVTAVEEIREALFGHRD